MALTEDDILFGVKTHCKKNCKKVDCSLSQVCGGSEGGVGPNGILIDDHDGTKFTAKKWTLAYAENGDKVLQRVEPPSLVAYDDIAANSTCMEVKVSASLADFVELAGLYGFERVYLWRGSSWVWTSASWSDGIMSLTLQLVSQQS